MYLKCPVYYVCVFVVSSETAKVWYLDTMDDDIVREYTINTYYHVYIM